MAYRKRVKRAGRSLIKFGGKVMTVGHAAKCVGKGFKGCSNKEIIAAVKVVERVAAAAKRRNGR